MEECIGTVGVVEEGSKDVDCIVDMGLGGCFKMAIISEAVYFKKSSMATSGKCILFGKKKRLYRRQSLPLCVGQSILHTNND